MPAMPPLDAVKCLALVSLAIPLVSGLGCRTSVPPPPADAGEVGPGFGARYEAELVVRMEGGALVLPSGRRCSELATCSGELTGLQGKRLAVEMGRGSRLGELSAALALLENVLAPGELACLVVSAQGERRCVPFRPFDSEEFGAWLDAPKPPGKFRVVMRADGMEVVADGGKVPGPDRFGPSLPPLEGKPDIAGLDRLVATLRHRFDDEEAALLPSAAMEARAFIDALAVLSGPDAETFPTTYLVYP